MNLTELTIQKAREGLLNQEFSSTDLTKACLKRIEEKNPELNAFLEVSEALALEQAGRADELLKKKSDTHPLCGIPFSVKDAICVRGVRSSGAAKILENYLPPYTATTVERVLNRGAVLLGKVNCDAFGHGASNENSSYGPVKNPHDLTRVAGGSSGGSAAAVASGMGLFSIAEDTGGSVRAPASFCGTVGFKVSYGRNSRYGAMPMASSLDTVGLITRSVYDAAVVEEVMAGADQRDSTASELPVPAYTDFLSSDLAGITFGLPKEYFGEGLSDAVRAKMSELIEKAKKRGAAFREVSLPMTRYAIAVYYILVPCEDSSNLARLDGIRYGMRQEDADLFSLYEKTRAFGFPDEVKRRIMMGTYALSSGYYDAYYLKAQKCRTLIIRDFENVFEEVDALLTPTSPHTAFVIGEKNNDPISMYLEDVFLAPSAVAGLPSISIPVGSDELGLPIGAQVIAPYLREEKALSCAYALEQLLNHP